MKGNYIENSSYFIGILPDGTKKWYCEERDFKEEYYAELENRKKKKKNENENEGE